MATQLTQRLTCLALALGLGASTLVGSREALAETRPAYGGVIISSLLEEPLIVDPIAARTHTDMKLVGLLFDTLYREEKGAVVPQLASALPDVSNPLRVRIPLRERVFFHNGKAMRASDVVASLQRLKKSEIAFIISNVKSVSAETGAVVLELYAADENLASRLSSLHTAVTPKGRAPNWRRLVGSGPFQLKSRSTRTNELQLIAYPRYFAGRAYADEIRLRWFEDKSTETRNYETGAAHISMRGQIAFAGHRPKFKTEKRDFEAMLLVYVGFGKSNPLLGEESFRQALAAAIGRAGMTQIGSGEQVVPTLSPLPRSARGTVISTAGMTANLSKATSLLKELSEKYRALKSSSLLLDIIVNKSRPDDAIVAGRVAAALFALGIQTRLVVLQADAYASRVASGKCELYIGQLATPAEFPTDTLRAAYVAGGFQALLGAAAKKGRAGLERQFAAQLPLVPLFHRGVRVHHRSDLLSVGFDGPARLRYEDMFFYGTPQKN